MTETPGRDLRLPGAIASPWFLVCMAAGGFLCYRAACWTVFHSGFESAASDILMYARLAQIAGIVVSTVLSRFFTLDSFTWLKMSVGAAVVMTMGALTVVVAHFSPGVPPTVITVGCLVHGFFSSFLLLGWGFFFSSVEPKASALAIAGAFVLYSILMPAIEPLSPAVIGTCAVVLPVLCGVILTMVFPAAGFPPPVRTDFKQMAPSIPWGLFGLLFLCSVIGGVSRAILPEDIAWNETPFEFYWQLVALIVLMAFVYWTVRLKRDDPYMLWPLFTFVLLCGLLCFSSFYFIDKTAASALMRATQDHLMCFIWVCLTGVIYDRKLPKTLCFGLGAIALIHGEHFSAYLFGQAVPISTLAGGEFVPVVLATLMAFVLILVTMLALMRRANSLIRATAITVQTESSDDVGGAKAALVCAFELSEREAEVVGYLLRGYTYQAIAELMCVSPDTVRYHVKNIYRRAGVHNRQELIDLGQGYRGTLAERQPQ